MPLGFSQFTKVSRVHCVRVMQMKKAKQIKRQQNAREPLVRWFDWFRQMHLHDFILAHFADDRKWDERPSATHSASADRVFSAEREMALSITECLLQSLPVAYKARNLVANLLGSEGATATEFFDENQVLTEYVTPSGGRIEFVTDEQFIIFLRFRTLRLTTWRAIFIRPSGAEEIPFFKGSKPNGTGRVWQRRAAVVMPARKRALAKVIAFNIAWKEL